MWQYNYPPYLTHAKIGEERENHKYVARIPLKKVNGKQTWRYFYTNAEWDAYRTNEKTPVAQKTGKDRIAGKNMFTQIGDGLKTVNDSTKKKVDSFFTGLGIGIEKEMAKTPERLNKIVDKVKEVASDIYDDKDNIYDVNVSNYDVKIKKIAETPEWKAIVAREDPEYVKKNSDDTNNYLIDDYLAKKKMPLIDVIDDIVNNRPVTVNKIDKDAIVSGVKAKIFGAVSLGVLAANVVSKALIEKTKLSQGTYNDEVENLKTTINAGKEYVSKTIEASKVAKGVADQTVSNEDVQEVMRYIENTRTVDTVKETKRSIDEGKIVEAAKIILSADTIPDNVKESDYFKLTETTLSNLTEEEIVMLNIMLNSIMKGKT